MGPETAPTLSARKNLLARSVRNVGHIHSAWLKVRQNGLKSGSAQTRREILQFELDAPSRLRRIIEGLRHGSFEFVPQKGIKKKRPGKRPRPIVLADVGNRIVQRAILDVVQPHRLIRPILESPHSYGGIQGRGCREAIAEVCREIAIGKRFYIRSDIRDFFTAIPRNEVIDQLRPQLQDEEFCNLLASGSATVLANIEELAGDIELFPSHEKGVPQGSALSALLGNLYLHGFDREMNELGVRLIRYIDDFVILAPTELQLGKAQRVARALLKRLGLQAYEPGDAEGKATSGLADKGLVFLGVHIIPGRVVQPASTKRAALLLAVKRILRDGEGSIVQAQGSDPQAQSRERYVQVLARLDRVLEGWGKAYSFCNCRDTWVGLDAKIGAMISDYERFYSRRAEKATSDTVRRRMLGVRPLVDTPSTSWEELIRPANATEVPIARGTS
jgi:RNA-directed DNA polymerase